MTGYRRDGLIARLDILTPREAGQARDKLEAFIDTHGDDPRYGEWTYFKSHLALRWVAELAAHPVLLDHVEALIGPDILLWNSFIPAKPPASPAHFGWHQDATYWPIGPMENVVTFWLSLSHVSRANGGMRMIRGSHHRGQLAHQSSDDDSSMLRRSQAVEERVDETHAIEINLRPGQASVHHPLTLHGSDGNPSEGWRYAIGFNFVGGAVGPNEDLRDSALLLRGEAKPDGFDLETMPDGDLSQQALDNYQSAKDLGGSRYVKS